MGRKVTARYKASQSQMPAVQTLFIERTDAVFQQIILKSDYQFLRTDLRKLLFCSSDKAHRIRQSFPGSPSLSLTCLKTHEDNRRDQDVGAQVTQIYRTWLVGDICSDFTFLSRMFWS